MLEIEAPVSFRYRRDIMGKQYNYNGGNPRNTKFVITLDREMVLMSSLHRSSS